jgi:hypothetical protein
MIVDVSPLEPVRRHAQKKTLIARERDRADITRHRARWQSRQKNVDASRLVFIDETWTITNMTRLFDAPRAPMAIISNPLRSTRKSAQTDVISYATG